MDTLARHSEFIGKVFSHQHIEDIRTSLSVIEDDTLWSQHVNQKAYQGVWDVIALRCLSEHQHAHPIMQNFSHHNKDDHWVNLPIISEFGCIQALVDDLEKLEGILIKSVRFMRLHAGANILPHSDNGLGLEYGEARLHVPIISDHNVEFYVADEKVPMNTGELWYINADKTHWVNNNSTLARTHLVIDCQCSHEQFDAICQYIQSGRESDS
ncbi:aspartyl/asparaginyl beta-hydroxylase domain-containing protein [Marinomonas mediterranea]|jgi:Aspartyl/Asparaginyl beta-hydroxylase.|uniref:Aspartyl/Asparaginyl beta-hydroxylase n=1 Tax=Marinomonas mediterranea (strain ATCC 700492 / JCM 21426 / NBRC 103028 / MMB-1) TaxID=717774 RepID=F2JXR5_MARM1|nr:aspartyl/asparaginyl beta-hydroxylase domain-containing protein [Marinomonas mediterranea]ADZ93063.1 Aspartyl/Asparaginyl beta-hydroxylase [Marinomonas mediterranea MMB-1]WCN10970.1 aspartyl/asparaginyl beta-hydroxylase domain-containing protein [Marinomonas mediterranea]WCN15032.1 aspartyl/asparaginyl beta-hydroxylase domain-containing protein [Marinomonas mediterranea]WCN19076.1 aspartyl/asparaginyl beta-hydroxylase domain-containing protein [Marinomonas mediterranea MMB-1]